jgi:peptidoglycan/xylan/chitin deacetylase (PgdA/CDA1 family)
VNWAGFKAAVTYSFDDNNQSQITKFNDLKALGVPFTFFLWTGQASANNAVWVTASQSGHEIGNHTQSHNQASDSDVDAATNFIKEKFSRTPYTMAAPNGNTAFATPARTRFIINRGVSDKVIMPGDNSDPFNLPTYIPPPGAGQSQFDTSVNGARSAGGWRTMCIHGFDGEANAYQPVSSSGFIDHVKAVKMQGDVWIGTMEDVGAYWLGQRAFAAAMTATSGTDKTWTWTLPMNFPPKKYLRVKVDGGTLKQNGQALAWDPHGYYEISLDAKSVTLSP